MLFGLIIRDGDTSMVGALESSGKNNCCTLKPHPHWTRREKKRSKLGRANPVAATGLYTLHAKQHLTCTTGIWLHFVALRVASPMLLPVWMGPQSVSVGKGPSPQIFWIEAKCIFLQILTMKHWETNWRRHFNCSRDDTSQETAAWKASVLLWVKQEEINVKPECVISVILTMTLKKKTSNESQNVAVYNIVSTLHEGSLWTFLQQNDQQGTISSNLSRAFVTLPRAFCNKGRKGPDHS